MRKIKTVRTPKKRSGSRLSSLGYLLKEGVKNIWSNRTMSFASVGVLVSCLLLTGAAVLFSMNVDVAMKSLEGNNSTTVYLQEGLPTLTSLRVSGHMVVSHIMSGSFSPNPLERCRVNFSSPSMLRMWVFSDSL